MKRLNCDFMKASFMLTVLCTSLHAGDIFQLHDNPLPICTITNQEDGIVFSNKFEFLRLKPNTRYLDAGDIYCTVDIYAEIFQISTNFYSYEFARNAQNYKVEELKICFETTGGSRLLSIPCTVEGFDIAWGMDGTRTVQIYASFILTYGRCEYMKNNVAGLYLDDKRGVLRDQNKSIIKYKLLQKDLTDLISRPLALMERNFNRPKTRNLK